MGRGAVAVVLGSAFASGELGLELEPVEVPTRRGVARAWRALGLGRREAYVFFRHGLPHRLLPHQIDWRAQALAMRELEIGALLVTSSVGVLDADVPLNTPLMVGDLLMPGNRLPDGTSCSVFVGPGEEQGHLVLNEGLFSRALGDQVKSMGRRVGALFGQDVVFCYEPGPRTKTPAENRMWAALGAQVNSMSVGPEVVLANELEIPSAAMVVGHKYSHPDIANPDDAGIAESLERVKRAQRELVREVLAHLAPVPFGNHLYRFGG